MEAMTTSVGIPYAMVDITDNGPAQVCPICGEHCPMRVDEYGETTLSTYSDHYAKEHEKE